MKPDKVFPALLFLLLSSAFLFAQVASQDNQACNAEFARLLVDQQVSESKTVEETDKRIKILLRSADFLWKFEEETARKYFTEAFKVANERFNEKGFEQTKAGDKERSLITLKPDYRLEVIRAIAKQDGEWAKRLTEQILIEYEKTSKERPSDFNKTREVGDLLSVARESVKTNPNLSWYLFRRVMKYPLDSHWYFTLYSVATENTQIADALYLELLRNYANETPRRLLFLSAYPFMNERIFGIDKFQFGSSVPENASPNINLQKQFIETFFRRITVFANNADDINRANDEYRQPEALYVYTTLQEIEPIIMQNFPNLLEQLSEAKAQANSLMSEENRKKLETREKLNESFGLGFDGRLKLVEKADDEGKLKDRLIVDLIWAAKKEEDYKKIENWLNKIQDENVRRDATNFSYFQRSKLAIKENRFDEAKKYAERIVEIEHRASLYFEIAMKQIKDINETARVMDTLIEVSKMARQANDSVAKAQVLLGLANSFEKVNHSIALTELSEAINVINRLENPNIFSSSVHRQIVGKEFAFYASFSTPGYNMETTFEDISKKDFELSLANARNLNDKYFRTLAVLAVAKNCVQNAPKTKPKKNKP